MIRILMADDHLIVRRGLRSILAADTDLEIVAEAADGPEALAAYRAHRPDVVLLDLRMPAPGTASEAPEGPGVIAALRQDDPKARILVLTVQKGDEAIYQALKAGALGYLLKDAPAREIRAAIHAVAAGQSYVPAPVAERMARRLARPELTRRETEVARLVAQGLTNGEIAMRLGIVEKAAQAHVAAVMAKLGARDRTQAALLALDSGLVDVSDLGDDPPVP
jgi:two-component system NarL family response regulator